MTPYLASSGLAPLSADATVTSPQLAAQSIGTRREGVTDTPCRRGSAIQAWLTTVPGFLAAVGGLLTALVGAYIALRPAPTPPEPPLRPCRRLASLLSQDAALVRLLGKPETASRPTRIRL